MPFDGTTPKRYETGASVLLAEARELIEDPRRWCKGDLSKGFFRKRYCAYGALRAMAAKHGVGDEIMWNAARELYSAAHRRGFDGIGAFNDAPGTRHADVPALFDEAIESARADAYV